MKSLFLIIAGNHWKQFNRVHDYGDLVTFKLPCQNTMTQETCRRKSLIGGSQFHWVESMTTTVGSMMAGRLTRRWSSG